MEASRLSAGLSEAFARLVGELGPPELPRECRDELLDPQGWGQVLETYARTVNLAVALTDRAGRQIGPCHNPRPTWKLVRRARPELEGECSFCLVPAVPCTAAADAIRTGEVMLVEDGAGLVHVAVPLILRGQNLGALIAGQVFTRYPEPLRLQRVGRNLAISPQRLWHAAIHEVPISRAGLRVFATLLMTLGQAFLGERYALILHEELIEANRRISRSLQEKEVMLKEIQHRVRNNLQIVSSLLNMQSSGLNLVQDPKALQVLEASQQRVAAMGRIHDLLYGGEQVGRIDLAAYVRELAGTVISAFASEAIRIRPRFDLEAVPLSMRQAVPCGLILNELITNVFKYAYPKMSGGEIQIEVKRVGEDRIQLTISDQGVGLPAGLDWQHSKSVGMQIIGILTKQLSGTLELDAQHGASFKLQFRRDDLHASRS